MARKWPKIADPAISIRVMIEVFNAPLKDLMIIPELTSLRTRARRKIATVPIVPDSVGLKKPVIIPPMTMPKIMPTINASGITANLSFQVAFSALGAIAGLASYPSGYNCHKKSRYHERRHNPCKEEPAYGLLNLKSIDNKHCAGRQNHAQGTDRCNRTGGKFLFIPIAVHLRHGEV